MLKEILLKKKSAILKKWYNEILYAYSDDTSRFFKREKDRFHNPVGYTFTHEIEVIFDELLNESFSEELSKSLDNIIRIRAIQEFSASQAISFIFILKKILREELKNTIKEKSFDEQMLKLEIKIDDLALYSFDIYMQCREKMYDIKAREAKRSVSNLLRKANLIYEIPEFEEDLKEGKQH